MKEIINEFFLKEWRRENKTIEELLVEYELDERSFWNYVYTLNPIIVGKIKDENKRRYNNKKSLEIYRLLKDGTLTFGDVSRIQKTPIETIVELLQNEYLVKGIAQYSFEEMKQRNTKLLRERKEFQLYFYFIDHNVTFHELGEQFHLEETQIIYLFDSILDSELTSEEIKEVFTLNKNRETNRKYQQNKKRLFDLFILTEDELKTINDAIETLENQSDSDYKDIDALVYLKMRLTGDMLDAQMCYDALKTNEGIIRYRLNKLSADKIIPYSALAKLFIINMIVLKKSYMDKEENIEQMEHYMQLYAEYLNHPNVTILDIELQHKVNLKNGKLIDKKLGTHIFSEISNKIAKLEEKMNSMSTFGSRAYEYYQNHFILFRDLGSLLDIEQEKLQQYFSKNANEWKSICSIENQRLSLLQKDIQKLVEFEKLIDELNIYSKERKKDTGKLSDELSNLIQNPSMCEQLETRNKPVYFKTLIKSAQFIRLYLEQKNYDTKNLIENFQIKSHTTEKSYLYHPFVFNLLNEETKKYIRVKRKISYILGTHKGGQTVHNKAYNEKGQFVKKYQASEAIK